MDKRMNEAEGDLNVEAVLATLDDELLEEEAQAEIQEEIVEPEEELVASDADLIDDPDVTAHVDAEIAKEEVYAEAAAAAAASAPAPAKAARKKAETKPKAARDINTLDASAFVLTTDTPADLEANKAAVIRARPAQVKVAEKFDNVLLSIAAEKQPSVYTMAAYRALRAAGELTSADLVKELGKIVQISTARSQAGQMMALFPALQIAKRDKNKLVLNPDSILAEALNLLDTPKT